MPTANGSVTSTNGSQFRCVFTIDQFEHRFVGTVSPAVPQFTTTRATLTYDSISSLVGTKTFEGKLGIDDVQFTIGDGTEVGVLGALITPIRPAMNINGAATWTPSVEE